MKRLEERVALVTGAASGIGRATAERLASEGAVAVVSDVQDEAGERAAAAIRDGGGEALYVRLDVTDEPGWRAAVERVLAERGRLDVLVDDAGVGDLAVIEEASLSEWERVGADGRDRSDGGLPRHEELRRGAQGVWARVGDQHQLDLRHVRRVRHLAGLPCGEGRSADADEERRGPLGDRWRSRQLGASRLHPDADPRSGEGDGGLGGDDGLDADGPARRAGGDRRGSGVHGERRRS